ncbi:thioredoxin-like protein [Aspergillus pseudonomiae]|uniref:Thioredoxin n=1 Tax=Aspergillus pseudonomiae TaxID=1506151 RepID=A0A5N6IFR6_9EURO|nr:thioredoxin-like protein [Aspergillus pseudonomiae]KAB8265166.1 thioredoxin-like protein [Aspergillus pseudonomiae]KAE8402221.1 thioredoxin-like protein [Aspergillus pseudonomiae]
MSVVASLQSHSEFQTLINSGQVVIIDFWAPWCGPCRFISPVFEKLASDQAFSSIKFVKVNTDEQDDIATEVGIRSLPTFMVFQGGQQVDQLVGASPPALEQLVRKHA